MTAFDSRLVPERWEERAAKKVMLQFASINAFVLFSNPRPANTDTS